MFISVPDSLSFKAGGTALKELAVFQVARKTGTAEIARRSLKTFLLHRIFIISSRSIHKSDRNSRLWNGSVFIS